MLHDEPRIEEMQKQIDALKAQIQEQDIFLSKAIHNLKNLLTRVISCDQYILSIHSDQLTDTERKFLMEADESSFQMNDIFVAMNTISRVRRTTPGRNPLEMGEILNSVHNQLRGAIVSSGAQITYPTQWPAVMGDAFFVEKVWCVFLSNAIKYARETPQIRVTVEPLPRLRQVQFGIADNGPGLSEQHKALMYTPFPRIQVNSPNSGGVGLYMARVIVEQLGGTVGVESTPGRGSMFSFTLPAA